LGRLSFLVFSRLILLAKTFISMLNLTRKRGLLTKFATQ